jgi:hypothetical protein
MKRYLLPSRVTSAPKYLAVDVPVVACAGVPNPGAPVVGPTAPQLAVPVPPVPDELAPPVPVDVDPPVPAALVPAVPVELAPPVPPALLPPVPLGAAPSDPQPSRTAGLAKASAQTRTGVRISETLGIRNL